MNRTHEESRNSDSADDDIRRLITMSGPRRRPPLEMEDRVRAAVFNAIDELPESTSSTAPRLAMAASALVAVAVGYFLVGGITQVPAAGHIAFASGGYSMRGASSEQSDQIAAGAILQTSAEGRMLITLSEGVSVRIDQRTSATFQSSSEIWLHRGRIYVDSAGREALRITAPNASITDIGTQFEVTVEGEHLSVAVREGEVEVATASTLVRSSMSDGMGEILAIDGMRLLSRQPLSPVDSRWQWTQAARPLFKLDGHSVHDYLQWAARETGRRLIFENDRVRQQADLQRFGGQGEADTDVSLLLRTTRFQLKEGAVHELVVGFQSV